MPYIWIGIIVFAALSEIYTFALLPVWFIPGSLVSFILSLTGFHVWVQVFVFFIISFVLIFMSKTIFRKYINGYNRNSSLITGKSAIVTQEINNYNNTGKIKINGTEYAAKSDDDDIIYESGLIVSVIDIDGEYAVCSR